jgi:hypothetical protein
METSHSKPIETHQSQIKLPIVLKKIKLKNTPSPKRKPNKYAIFCANIFQTFKDEITFNIQCFAKELNIRALTLISKFWKSLSESDRKTWIELHTIILNLDEQSLNPFLQKMKEDFITFVKYLEKLPVDSTPSIKEQVLAKFTKCGCQVDHYLSNSEIHYICACGTICKTHANAILKENWGGCSGCKFERGKKTLLSKYGYEYTMQIQSMKDKSVATTMQKWGVRYPFQVQSVKDKAMKTNMSRYGVPYPMQNPLVAHKSVISCMKLKTYTLPSGKIIKVQGYEPLALDYLIPIYGEDNIAVSLCDDVPTIPYLCPIDNIWRQYYPDIYIPSENLIIEVKSAYTFDTYFERNIAKFKATIDAEYRMKIMIMKKSGEIDRTIESVEDFQPKNELTVEGIQPSVGLDSISEEDADPLVFDEDEYFFDENVDNPFNFSSGNDTEEGLYINADESSNNNDE